MRFNILATHKFLFFVLLNSINYHFLIIDYVPFYRDLISFSYLLLVILLLKNGHKFDLRINVFNSYLIFFICLLFLSGLDTNKRLYPGTMISTATVFVSEDYVVFYILRNAFIYVPVMLFYYIKRGALSKGFIEQTFLFFLLNIPFSLYIYTKSLFEIELSFQSLLVYGQQFITYNSYVPFLAFPVIISFYFLMRPIALYIKLFSIVVFFIIFFYTFISSSRQSLIFIFIIAIILLINQIKIKKLIFALFVFLFLVSIIQLVINSFEVNREVVSKLIERDQSVLESTRLDKIIYGFSLLKPIEFIFGAGISSVPDGGPHNDFVRWIQRSGLFVGMFGFIPFILLLINSIRRLVVLNDDIYFFILISSIFTIYTSFFGYPRDDVFQSLFVFLGPILFYGYNYSRG